MDTTKKNVKETIESSKSAEELLNNIDTLNPPLAEEKLSNVAGGGPTSSKLQLTCSTAKMFM